MTRPRAGLKRHSGFIKTSALRRYRDEHGLSNHQLAEKLGTTPANISYWCNHDIAPREKLELLGLKPRTVPVRRAARHSDVPAGGTIYACYVGVAERGLPLLLRRAKDQR